MKGNQFEYILGNLSFAFLLLSMLSYWFQASFESNTPIGSDGTISLLPIDPSKGCFQDNEPFASLQSSGGSAKLIPSIPYVKPENSFLKERAEFIDGGVNPGGWLSAEDSVGTNTVDTNKKSSRKTF